MPRGRKKQPVKRRGLLFLALLLSKFFLIKLGGTPILLINKVIRFLSDVLSLLPSFHLPTIGFPRLSRKRGRPSKRSIISICWGKIPKFTRVVVVSILVIIIFISYTAATLQTAYLLPSPERLVSTNKPLTTEFYDRNGELLYRLYEGRNRSMVQLSDLPSYLIQATIAIEDRHFYSHPGVDFSAIFRALKHNLDSNNLQGASTITQQLVKNSLLTPEKTYQRKIKEIILALWAERIYSKEQILQMYFNETPYGGPAWGIEAAAQTYFGKSAKDLTLAQSAYLAGLPASPTTLSPYGSNPELGYLRQKEVLRKMVEERYVSQEEAEKAEKEELQIKPPLADIQAPHFVMYVRDQLASKYGQRVVSQGGFKVTTALDLGLQKVVEGIVSEEVAKLGSLQVTNGAAMVTDPQTGQILSLVGSRDYFYPGFGNFNVATSLRQPGSSIKPVTYATAFKKGYSPGNTILDTPITFSGTWGNSYSPVNYDGAFHGPVSIRTALGSSYNIPAVKILATVGIPEVIQTAKDLGITTFTDPKRYGLSLTLGGAEVKMVDMMSVYGAFASLGVVRTPTPILKVQDSEGNVLEEYKDKPTQALQPEIAYLITHILSDNGARTPAFGLNSLLNIPGQAVAVKTGTSDNKRDNWTFGYTGDFVVGVWVGNNNNRPMNPTLTSGITGAAPIWNRIMAGLLSKYPSVAFKKPPGVLEVNVDGRKDLAVAGILPKGLVKARFEADKTVYFDSFSSFATTSALLTPKQPSL